MRIRPRANILLPLILVQYCSEGVFEEWGCSYIVHKKLALKIVGEKIFLIHDGPAATRATIFDHRVSPSDLAFVAAQTFHT